MHQQEIGQEDRKEDKRRSFFSTDPVKLKSEIAELKLYFLGYCQYDKCPSVDKGITCLDDLNVCKKFQCSDRNIERILYKMIGKYNKILKLNEKLNEHDSELVNLDFDCENHYQDYLRKIN